MKSKLFIQITPHKDWINNKIKVLKIKKEYIITNNTIELLYPERYGDKRYPYEILIKYKIKGE